MKVEKAEIKNKEKTRLNYQSKKQTLIELVNDLKKFKLENDDLILKRRKELK